MTPDSGGRILGSPNSFAWDKLGVMREEFKGIHVVSYYMSEDYAGARAFALRLTLLKGSQETAGWLDEYCPLGGVEVTGGQISEHPDPLASTTMKMR